MNEPYKKKLQFALTSTTHTANHTVSCQAECPKTPTVHKFYAFRNLRSGHRLQWRNIAHELLSRVLSFSCHETHALIIQAAWQVGPFSQDKVYREFHVDFKEKRFGMSLLLALKDATGTIEGNWQGATAVHTFITLASRLLSLSTCDMVRTGCYQFLRRARVIPLRWTRELEQILQKQKGKELEFTNLRLHEMALTCHGTFNVDIDHLSELLHSDEDIAIAIKCAIVVHDRCPANKVNISKPLKLLLR